MTPQQMQQIAQLLNNGGMLTGNNPTLQPTPSVPDVAYNQMIPVGEYDVGMTPTQNPSVDNNKGNKGQGNQMQGGGEVLGNVSDSPKTFTFVEGKERDGSHAKYLWDEQGEPQQVTEAELRAYYNDPKKVNRLPEVFGSFDNYLAYMTEREELIQSGELDIGGWSSADDEIYGEVVAPDAAELMQNGGDYYVDPNGNYARFDSIDTDRELQEKGLDMRMEAYDDWLNGETNKALLEKYGVKTTVYSDSGDKFQWNGSGYVKTKDESNAISGGDILKVGLAIAAGAMTGGAATGALTSALGSTGASVAGSVLGSAVSQGITTGNLDPEKLAVSAITAGIGELANSFEAGTTMGDLGESFRDGVSQIADALNTDTAAVMDVIGEVTAGAITGQDLEQIALNAVGSYASSQLEDFISNTYGDDPLANIISAGGTEAVDQLITQGGVDPEQIALVMAGQGGVELVDYVLNNYMEDALKTEYVMLDPDGNPVHTFDTYENAVAWYESDGRQAGYELGEISKDIPEWLIPILEGGGDAGEMIGRTLDSLGVINLGLNPEDGLSRNSTGNEFYFRGSDGTLYERSLETGEWEVSDSTREVPSTAGYYDDRGVAIDGDEQVFDPETLFDIIADDDEYDVDTEEETEVIVDPTESTVEDPFEDPFEEVVTDPVEDPVDEVVTDPVEDPVDEVVTDPTDTTNEDTTDPSDTTSDDTTDPSDSNSNEDTPSSDDANGDDNTGGDGDSGDGDGDAGEGDGEGEGEGDGTGNGNGFGNFQPMPTMGGGGFKPFNSGLSYQNPQLLNQIQYQAPDAAGQLNNMLGRLKQKRGMFNI